MAAQELNSYFKEFQTSRSNFTRCCLVLHSYQHLAEQKMTDCSNVRILLAFLIYVSLISNSLDASVSTVGARFLNRQFWRSHMAKSPWRDEGTTSDGSSAVYRNGSPGVVPVHRGKGRTKTIAAGCRGWLQPSIRSFPQPGTGIMISSPVTLLLVREQMPCITSAADGLRSHVQFKSQSLAFLAVASHLHRPITRSHAVTDLVFCSQRCFNAWSQGSRSTYD